MPPRYLIEPAANCEPDDPYELREINAAFTDIGFRIVEGGIVGWAPYNAIIEVGTSGYGTQYLVNLPMEFAADGSPLWETLDA